MLCNNFQYWDIFILVLHKRAQKIGKESICESKENNCLSQGLKEKNMAILTFCIDQVSCYLIFSAFFFFSCKEYLQNMQ